MMSSKKTRELFQRMLSGSEPDINGSRSGMRKGVGWIVRWLFLLALGGSIVGSLVMVIIFWGYSRSLPQIISVGDYRPPAVTHVFAANNGPTKQEIVGEFYKERRYVIPYEKIPDIVVKAFISAEDDTFFNHQGINFASILRASIANFRAGHVVQGGSTITQQVAKSLLLTPEKSFSRKIKEVLLAYKIEHNLSKQQILFLYLNQIYLGRGAYGVQAASRAYFRKDVSALTLAEAAVIAGLPQAPGKYGPHLNPRKAKDRQLYVLRRMAENQFISKTQMADAAAQPIRLYYEENPNQTVAPYLVEHVRRYLEEKYGEQALYEGGLSVFLPTDAALLKSATNSVQESLRAVDKRQGYRGPAQKLKTVDDVEKFLRDQRQKMVERKVQYQLFMPDGRLDPVEAIRESGLKGDSELLGDGEIYEAVVTSIDDRKKSAGVMIGAVHLELPLAKMKWARPVRDGKVAGPEPSLPSQVLSKHDVVLVRALKIPKDGTWSVALEQEPIVQGALFSMDTQTGAVLAMVGGYDFEKSKFNRVVQALRQAGSSFKPIIYAAGLEKGFTPASVIIDAPITVDNGDEGKWKPNNFEEKFYGDTTFRQALIKSRNVPTIRIVQEVEVPFLIDYAKRLGMNTQFPTDLSIALGTGPVSPLELAKVYALFPRLGKRVDPIFIWKIVDRDGKVLEETKPEPFTPLMIPPTVSDEQANVVRTASAQSERVPPVLPIYPLPQDPAQVLDPRVAAVMTHLMKEVVNYGTGYEAKNLGRPAAGKTGTTNDYMDAWFAGFTPHVVTVSWVGFDTQVPLGPGETVARAALPIWLSFMKEAVKKYPDTDFPMPSGVVFASIDSSNGKPVEANSSRAIKEAFIEGTQPTRASGGLGGGAGGGAESTGDFLKEDLQ